MSQAEFSRIVRLNTVGDGKRAHEIAADEGERAALARRFGLVVLDRLEARATITPEAGGWRVEGTLDAALAQSCVATGEPVPTTLRRPFVVRYVADGADDTGADEIELSGEACDVLVLEGEWIDLGETVAQSLALELDPFPRAPGADAFLREKGVMREEEAGPFGVLAALKGKLG